jgi:hypothetical protein
MIEMRCPCSSLREYLQLEFKEILEGDNPWYAGEKLFHKPDAEECARWYTDHGGADDFGTRYYVVAITVSSQ